MVKILPSTIATTTTADRSLNLNRLTSASTKVATAAAEKLRPNVLASRLRHLWAPLKRSGSTD